MGSLVDELIAQGAQQASRKNMQVYLLPKSPVDFLREEYPEIYDRLVMDTLERFELEARRAAFFYARHDHALQLTSAEFEEFREKTTGKKQWTKADKEACGGCGSFGHMHRRDCSSLKRPRE